MAIENQVSSSVGFRVMMPAVEGVAARPQRLIPVGRAVGFGKDTPEKVLAIAQAFVPLLESGISYVRSERRITVFIEP